MTKLLQRLVTGAEWLSVASGYVASTALLIMTVGVTLDVLARFLLGAGTMVAIEMSGYSVVAIVFFGLAYTHKTNGHIEIDFLVKRFPARAQRWSRMLNSIVFLAYTVLLGYFGWRTFWTSYDFNTTSRTGLDVLIWPYQLIIPMGLLITSLLLASGLCLEIARGFRNETGDSTGTAS